MRMSAPGGFILVGVTAVLLAAGLAVPEGKTAAQSPVTLAVDADPTGNTATSLGSIEDCLSVDNGATLEVDIVITNVENLLGWEAFFEYDEAILEVTDVDVRQFQMANPKSNVINASEPLPDRDGVFLAAAADPRSVDSGSGVLARLTLQAIGTGISPAALPTLAPGVGPTLAALTYGSVEHIGDNDGDNVFDGETTPAQIAVGVPCSVVTPTPSPTPGPTPGPGQTPPAGTPTPTPSPSPKTGDADDDRVADMDDQCPGTTTDADVDASGCSETQLEQLTQQAEEQLLGALAAGLNLAVSLETVAVGGSTTVLAVLADGNGEPLSGADIAFKIDEQPGGDANLDGGADVTKTADAEGFAEATLNVGSTPGEIVVSATAEGQTETVTVTVGAVEAAASGPTASEPASEPGDSAADGPAGDVIVAPGATTDGSSDGGGLPTWMVLVIVAAALVLAAGALTAWRAARDRAV